MDPHPVPRITIVLLGGGPLGNVGARGACSRSIGSDLKAVPKFVIRTAGISMAKPRTTAPALAKNVRLGMNLELERYATLVRSNGTKLPVALRLSIPFLAMALNIVGAI